MPDLPQHRRFKVPREDRSLLTIPSLEMAPQVIRANRTLFQNADCSLNGQSLKKLRQTAKDEAMALARRFTSSLIGKDVPESTSDSMIVSGHQPELFHVGVWTKNFALAGIAGRNQSVAVNLIIDNDTMNGTSIRIPTGSRELPRIDRIPFDGPHPTQPWEEVEIRNRELFNQFGQIVDQRVRSTWGFTPIISQAWEAAVRHARVSNRLCDCLTAMRACVEWSWGMSNLELPMSQLCETKSFLWFVAHLLLRLPELNSVYNESVAEYRNEHRLRNRMQPVPDLDRVDDWYEAPFWIWKKGDHERGRLFARRLETTLELRGEEGVVAQIPLTNGGSLDQAVSILGELPKQGFRLRTRALTTTLFARILLADLFVHGIGGAKYDEMTDQICRRMFGLEPPQFLTVSSTLLLPMGGPFGLTQSDLHTARHQLRDLNFNPDRHLQDFAAASDLIREKDQILLAANSSRESGQYRGRLTSEQHQRIERIRQELNFHAATIKTNYDVARRQIEGQLFANRLINDREYSFLLYPERYLREFLTPLFTTTS
jgi:hypothetical protein